MTEWRDIPGYEGRPGRRFPVMAQLPDDDLGTAFVYIDPKGRVFTGPYPRFMALADGMTLVPQTRWTAMLDHKSAHRKRSGTPRSTTSSRVI